MGEYRVRRATGSPWATRLLMLWIRRASCLLQRRQRFNTDPCRNSNSDRVLLQSPD